MDARLLGGVLWALWLAGCATASGGGSRFPSPSALDALGPAPSPSQLAVLESAEVDRWDVSGQLPDSASLTPATYQGGFGALLQGFAQRRPEVFATSADMACIARETGRFVLAHGGGPPRGLQRFIAGRCGSLAVRHRLLTLSGETPEFAPEDEVLARWRGQFDQMLSALPAHGSQSAGVWYGRSGRKVVVVLTSAERAVRLDPVSLSPAADGTVSLRGELLQPAIRLEALVNRGRYQYAACSAEPGVQLPRFAFRCAVSRADPSTWVTLFLYPPGQFLGNAGADLLVFPQGKALSTYARPALRAPPGAAGEDGARFAQLLNGLRAEVGLSPVRLSEGESRTARKVAPHYFAALIGVAPRAVADTVALGMLAGWGVEQVTREAYFSADWSSSTDVATLLAEMIDHPGARRTLFEPAIRELAFGAFRLPEHKVLGALVTTYAPFEEVSPAAEAKKVVDALNRARAERGLGPAELVPLLPDAKPEMDQVLASGGSSRDALRVVLQRALQLTGQNVSGVVVEAGSLEALTFPDDLVRRSPLVVFVSVTHYRPKGEPWGRYVVALAFTAQLTQTAAVKADGPPLALR